MKSSPAVHTVKIKVKILQNFVAFSEYMNFNLGNFRDRSFSCGDGAESVQDTRDNFQHRQSQHLFATPVSNTSSSINQQQNTIQNTANTLVPTGNG